MSLRVTGPDVVDSLLDDAARERDVGADMVEWRLDPMADDPSVIEVAERLVRESPLPSIITVRDAREQGAYFGSDDDRRGLLLAICRRAMPMYLDVELATVERDALLRAALRGLPEATRIILSAHDFSGRPADLVRRVAAAASEPCCAVIKVAWMARSVRDNLEAFELLAHRPKPMVALCMGEAGELSRGLAARAGDLWTYARPATGDSTAPGQPTASELVEGWRLREQSASTLLYGIVGWPVSHSRSPALHSQWFRQSGVDAVYARLPVPPEWEHFKASAGALVDDPHLNFRGASVTMPHKAHLVRFVRERGGHVDQSAAHMDAANTLVVRRDGSLEAINTDALAIRAIASELLGRELAGRRALVLGCGGAGRAAIATLAGAGVRVVAWNRSGGREGAARALGAEQVVEGDVAWSGRSEQFDLVIQATSLGMAGGPDPTGLPGPLHEGWPSGAALLETVYEPQVTPAMELALAAGVRVVGGLAMLERQARLQSERWKQER